MYSGGNLETIKGWNKIDSKEFDQFISKIEENTNIPLTIISCGAGRNDIIERESAISYSKYLEKNLDTNRNYEIYLD